METEVLPTAHDVAARASEIILAAARSAIEQRGDFSLVLAGGSTPADCYTLLAAAQADWRRWHIYFGDERCLDPSAPERNSAMAAARLTDRVPIPAQQVHPIPTERGPQVAANDYRDTIRGQLPFDLVLLGMGEDGHVASLFPGSTALEETDRLVVAVNDDDSVRRLKGDSRPVNSQEQRMDVLAGLGAVDWVVPFAEDTPERLICRVLPEFLVKGGDNDPEYKPLKTPPGKNDGSGD